MFDLSWILLRLAALFALAGFLIDIEILVFFLSFLFFHINLGLKAVISDYIHIKKVKLILITFIRISSIEMVRYTLELLL